MAASRRSPAVPFALLALLVVTPLASQVPVTVSGRIVRTGEADGEPVGGAAVTLHRISRTAQGAVDSLRTGSDGRFRFSLAGDTTAVYLVSARFAGIEYFGPPLRTPGARDLEIVVSDTSSTAPVTLAARRVIIRRPDESGTRLVVDLFSLRNDGTMTRVGKDSLSPSWQVVLPAGVLQAEVQEGDVSPTAVRFAGDTLLVLAPIAPGQKNVMVSYRIPMGHAEASWTAPADSFDLMVEEPSATVTGAGLAAVAPIEVEEARFLRWSAVPPERSGVATVQFGDAAVARTRVLVWLVAAMILVGGALGAWALRGRRRRPGDESTLARGRSHR